MYDRKTQETIKGLKVSLVFAVFCQIVKNAGWRAWFEGPKSEGWADICFLALFSGNGKRVVILFAASSQVWIYVKQDERSLVY